MIIQILFTLLASFVIIRTAECNGAIFRWTKTKNVPWIDVSKEKTLLGTEDAKQQT